MATNIDAIVREAQLRGILLTQDPKGKAWHAEINHGGEVWSLDDADPQNVYDDAEALLECLGQDDVYSEPEYNEDLDRFIISVNGAKDPFTAPSLREAFAMAKSHVMGSAKPTPAAEPKRRAMGKKAAAPQPEPEPVEEAEEAAVESQDPREPGTEVNIPTSVLPGPIVVALVDLINSLNTLVCLVSARAPVSPIQAKGIKAKGNGQEELQPFEEPEVATNEPPPKRRTTTRKQA